MYKHIELILSVKLNNEKKMGQIWLYLVNINALLLMGHV